MGWQWQAAEAFLGLSWGEPQRPLEDVEAERGLESLVHHLAGPELIGGQLPEVLDGGLSRCNAPEDRLTRGLARRQRRGDPLAASQEAAGLADEKEILRAQAVVLLRGHIGQSDAVAVERLLDDQAVLRLEVGAKRLEVLPHRLLAVRAGHHLNPIPPRLMRARRG